ncbi:MAG: lipoyl synthase [Bacteroidetes bacterium]|nr:lipoyl synthase [Bacteroidota bacterium]MDA0944224.1 lipoyl synthase [Bacteroidota bacterium]MDA1112458.1 lipoyl synthase [Bacteroidota bacterium]
MIELPVVSKEPRRPSKPSWLKIDLPTGENYTRVKKIVKEHKLHTICEDGRCPNMGECWGAGTATFMILGNVCTRSCSFCAVATGRPGEYDLDEPYRVAEAVRLMGVKHCVITSVNRDELKDKGATVWAETIREVKKQNPGTTIETLIPDFKAQWDLLYQVLDARPDVVSHNMETVERLYRLVRPQAKYARSLEQIQRTKAYGARTKSGAMLGCGETPEEVFQLMRDLHENGCDVLTLGQYLQPTKMHLPVADYVHPDQFKLYEEKGLEMGFMFVESGPMVRSSYHAEKHVL